MHVPPVNMGVKDVMPTTVNPAPQSGEVLTLTRLLESVCAEDIVSVMAEPVFSKVGSTTLYCGTRLPLGFRLFQAEALFHATEAIYIPH